MRKDMSDETNGRGDEILSAAGSRKVSYLRRAMSAGLFRNDRTFTQPIASITTIFLILLHIGAIAALFLFSWKALLMAALLYWIAGSLGIGMCYHRLLTHRGYQTPKWMEYFLTICGTLALEGGPITWVATHRAHHQNADKEGDPHSPRDGGLWSHIGWVIAGRVVHTTPVEFLSYVPDLRRDPFHRWISTWNWLPLTGLALLLFTIGGLPFVLWGICLRTVIG